MKVTALANISGHHGDQPKGARFEVSPAEAEALRARGLVAIDAEPEVAAAPVVPAKAAPRTRKPRGKG